MSKKKLPKDILEFFKRTGSKGGKIGGKLAGDHDPGRADGTRQEGCR